MVRLCALIDIGVHLVLLISSFMISFTSVFFVTVLVEINDVASAVINYGMLDDIHVHIVVVVAMSNFKFFFSHCLHTTQKVLTIVVAACFSSLFLTFFFRLLQLSR